MDKIINKLKETNCIKEGSFILRNGETSKYYFDMKNLVSHPELLSQIGDMIYLSFIKDKVISINNTTNNTSNTTSNSNISKNYQVASNERGKLDSQ